MLADRVLAIGEIDAEALVAACVGRDPVQRSEPFDGAVGGARGAAKLHHRHAADARNVAFDQKSLHVRHEGAPRDLLDRTIAPGAAKAKLNILGIAKGWL